MTPLGVAAKNGADGVFSYLLDQGAEIEAKNTFGCTPLFWATQNGHEGIAIKLLQHRARTDVKTRLGGNKSIQSLLQSKPQLANLFKQYGQSG